MEFYAIEMEYYAIAKSQSFLLKWKFIQIH